MSIKLAAAKPDDRYARLYYKFTVDDGGNPRAEALTEEKSDDNSGWIELWAGDAKACKESLRRITGRLYVLQERREKRSKELTDEKAMLEMEEYNNLLVDGLAFRTKAWRLIDSNGSPVDAPVTFENAKAVYGDKDHNLGIVVRDFVNEAGNFPLRASSAS